MSPYTIVLADDHAMFREGTKKIISESPDLKVIGEAADGLELLKLLKRSTPDLIVLDISMPNLRGLEAAREIKKSFPEIKILILTMHKKEEFIYQALAAGAEGFLLKEDAGPELVQAIQTIRRGEKFISPLLSSKMADLALQKGQADPLTTREKEVVKLFAEGKSSKEIAELLYISVFTVRRHRDNIMRKLHLKNMADLVRYALGKDYTSDNT